MCVCVCVCVCVCLKYLVKQTSFAYCKQLHEHKLKFKDRQYIGPIMQLCWQLRCGVLCIIINTNQLITLEWYGSSRSLPEAKPS